MASIDKFKSSVSAGRGLALQNRYEVIFHFPSAIATDNKTIDTINILCDSATIPARTIATFEYQAQKQSYKIPAGYSQEEVSFTFLLTNDYLPKRLFDAWTESIINFETYRLKYHQDYTTDLLIHQLDINNQLIYGCKLHQAYPTAVSAVTLENSAENSVQRVSVNMAYKYFEYTN